MSSPSTTEGIKSLLRYADASFINKNPVMKKRQYHSVKAVARRNLFDKENLESLLKYSKQKHREGNSILRPDQYDALKDLYRTTYQNGHKTVNGKGKDYKLLDRIALLGVAAIAIIALVTKRSAPTSEKPEEPQEPTPAPTPAPTPQQPSTRRRR